MGVWHLAKYEKQHGLRGNWISFKENDDMNTFLRRLSFPWTQGVRALFLALNKRHKTARGPV